MVTCFGLVHSFRKKDGLDALDDEAESGGAESWDGCLATVDFERLKRLLIFMAGCRRG